MDSTVAQEVVHVPHSKKVPGSIPRLDRGLSVWSLHVLPVHVWVLSRHPSFLPQSKNMVIRLIGDSNLPLGVSVNGCLTLYVALPSTADQVYPASRPMTTGIASSTPLWPRKG